MKAYIRLTDAGDIFYCFNDSNDTVLDGDICITGHSDFEDWMASPCPAWCEKGIPQYRYIDGRIIKKTPEEIENWRPATALSLEDQVREQQKIIDILLGGASYDG